jgi:hypothetical protein
MQSESELLAAEAAEKAAIEKDLENWQAREKELAAQFDREQGKNLEEELTKDYNNRKTTHAHTYTYGGQDKAPIIKVPDFEREKERIQASVAIRKEQELERAKEAYLEAEKAARLEAAQQKEQQQAAEQVQQPEPQIGLQPIQPEKYKALEQEAIREVAKVEITQPMRNTDESLDLALEKILRELEARERAQERGLDYGRGLGHEI